MAPKSLFLLYQKMNNFEKSYFLSTIIHSNDVFMQCTVRTCLKVKLDLVKFNGFSKYTISDRNNSPSMDLLN